MEQRREPRLKVSKTVRLKVLDRMSGPSLGHAVEAQVVDVSGSGVRLHLGVPVPCGAPVEVSDHHMLMLGEVCRCVREEDGAYTVGLRIFEMLAAADGGQSYIRARS